MRRKPCCGSKIRQGLSGYRRKQTRRVGLRGRGASRSCAPNSRRPDRPCKAGRSHQERSKYMTGNGLDEELEGEGPFDETDEVLDDELNTVLDDAAREELDSLVGLQVVGLDVWEESLLSLIHISEPTRLGM